MLAGTQISDITNTHCGSIHFVVKKNIGKILCCILYFRKRVSFVRKSVPATFVYVYTFTFTNEHLNQTSASRRLTAVTHSYSICHMNGSTFLSLFFVIFCPTISYLTHYKCDALTISLRRRVTTMTHNSFSLSIYYLFTFCLIAEFYLKNNNRNALNEIITSFTQFVLMNLNNLLF